MAVFCDFHVIRLYVITLLEMPVAKEFSETKYGNVRMGRRWHVVMSSGRGNLFLDQIEKRHMPLSQKSLAFVIFPTKNNCIQGGCRHKTFVNGTQNKRRQKLMTCVKKKSS
jgi:hypothetical protein